MKVRNQDYIHDAAACINILSQVSSCFAIQLILYMLGFCDFYGIFLLPKTEFDVLNFSLVPECCERVFSIQAERTES